MGAKKKRVLKISSNSKKKGKKVSKKKSSKKTRKTPIKKKVVKKAKPAKKKATKKPTKKATKKTIKKVLKKAVKTPKKSKVAKRLAKKKEKKEAKKTAKVKQITKKSKIPTQKSSNQTKRASTVRFVKPTSTGPQFLVAIAQISTRVGDLDANTRKIIATIQKAKDAGAEMVIFPELTLTGYPPKDLLQRQDFIDINLQKFIEVVSQCRGITCIFGFANNINGTLHNSLAIVKDQKIIGIENKANLPSHPYFDENKYFSEGKRADIITVGSKRFGIALCPNLFEEQTHIEQLVNKGVDGIITVSASPYAVRKPQEREQLGRHIAKRFEVPLIYCNAVGANDALIFDGSSFLVDKKGTIVARAKKFSEDLLLVNINEKGAPFNPTVNQASEVYQALTLGIREYFTKTGLTKAVVGISGGVDSAVTAAIATHALGQENVIGVMMPSKITSKESIQDAKRICINLGIECKKINIDTLALPTARALGLKYEKKNISIAEQNIQARTRGQVLLSLANKENAVVLTTVNKSALAVGYCIIGGDMAGTLAPLADLWKTQVQSVGDFINALYKRKHKKFLIPQTVMKRAPSAELRMNQLDTDDIPPYETLDKVLQFYIAHKKDIHQIVKLGFDAELVRSVAYMVQRSQFKRGQMPLALHISASPLASLVLPVVSGWRG